MRKIKAHKEIGVGIILTLAFLLILILSHGRVFAAKGGAAGTTATGDAATVTPTPVPTPTPTPPPPGKGKLRLMYTTDTHGQINDMDYQRQTRVVRGLNRISTMMKVARREMNDQNCMAFDVGDNIMDYTTDFIYDADPFAIQPVYKALAKLNYDAITVGNHEFDYGLDYLIDQLNGSGLKDKVILSNVTSKYSGEFIYGKENRIIEKEVVDYNGYTHIVKVGLFGAAPPNLSSRTEKSTASLKTVGFCETAAIEVQKLKEQGADIIVALAHTGVGTENPSPNAANAGYGMTKVDGLDVILGGHQHIYFPDSSYSYLPGIDPNTWMVNGTRFLVMRAQARSLGIVDLNLSFDAEGHVCIDSSDYDIRKVTSNVTPDPAIDETMDKWGPKITAASSVKIGDIGEHRWSTYMAQLESNPILQTVQNAQRAYGYQYILQNAPDFAGFPLICATRYGMYGNESGQEYGDVTGAISAGRIQDFARYQQYEYIYWITGAQLKEWIEWTASVYQQPGTSGQSQWGDSIIADYVRNRNGESLVTSDNVREWKNYFLFGGIEYTINPQVPSRYSMRGDRISDYERVTSLTMNGVPITPEQQFVIVTDQLLDSATLQVDATRPIWSQKIADRKKLLQNIVTDYLKSQSQYSYTDLSYSTNWTLDLPAHYRFLIMTGDKGADVVKASPWYVNYIANANGYGYFECEAPEQPQADVKPPCLSLLPSSYVTSDEPVNIKVMANDLSGITEVKYAKGTLTVDDANWSNPEIALDVVDNLVTVTESGIYSFLVRDGAGNPTVQSIAITNIDPDALQAPTIDKVDNNDTAVLGTGQIGTTINVQIGDNTYTGTVDADGDYSVDIPVPRARTVIRCFVSDSKGRTSTATSTRVKRVGPNMPSGSAANNSYYIKGKTNDSDVKLFALVKGKIYVSKKLGTSYYKKCKKYNENKEIKKTSITVSKSGNYNIQIPHMSPGKVVKVYSIDQFGRVSYAKEISVARKAYEPVSCFTTFSTEKAVFGHIREEKRGYLLAYYADGTKAGSGYSDGEGYFHIPISRELEPDETVTIYAKYTASDAEQSHPAELKVDDVEDADTGNDVRIRKVAAGAGVVSGNTDYRYAIVSVLHDGSYQIKSADRNGDFRINLENEPKEGDRVSVFVRSIHGYFQTFKKKTVTLAPPEKPVVEKASTYFSAVNVLSHEKVTMTLRVRKKLYRNPKVYYSKAKKSYVYKFTNIENLYEGEGIRIVAYAQNEGGKTRSDVFIF